MTGALGVAACPAAGAGCNRATRLTSATHHERHPAEPVIRLLEKRQRGSTRTLTAADARGFVPVCRTSIRTLLSRIRMGKQQSAFVRVRGCPRVSALTLFDQPTGP